MTGKKLVSNLKSYLEPLFDIPVYTFDRNQTRELPCIVVGYESEESSMAGIFGHYTVSGYCKVIYQGYEDSDNSLADDTAQDMIDYLCDREELETSLNKPLSGTDTRPLTGFGINRLLIRGTSRDEDDNSTIVTINYDAYTVAKDF